MSIPVDIIYKGLVKRGTYTIDKVPKEYRESVQKLLNGESENNNEEPVEESTEEFVKYGAVTLPKINGYPVDVDSVMMTGKIRIDLEFDVIFPSDLFSVFPRDVQYSIQRVENIWNRFRSKVDVIIDTIDEDALVLVNGFPSAICNPGDTLLRIDLKIESSNYEDMYLTIYLCAK